MYREYMLLAGYFLIDVEFFPILLKKMCFFYLIVRSSLSPLKKLPGPTLLGTQAVINPPRFMALLPF